MAGPFCDSERHRCTDMQKEALSNQILEELQRNRADTHHVAGHVREAEAIAWQLITSPTDVALDLRISPSHGS